MEKLQYCKHIVCTLFSEIRRLIKESSDLVSQKLQQKIIGLILIQDPKILSI